MLELAFLVVALLSLVAGNVFAIHRFGAAAGAPPVTIVRATGIVAGWGALMVAGVALAWLMTALLGVPWYLAGLVLGVGLPPALILCLRLVGRMDGPAALRLLGVAGLASAVVGGFALVPTAFVLRSFKSPGNAMAPTILGRHFVGACPMCAGPTIVSTQPGEENSTLEPSEFALCANCGQWLPANQVGTRLKSSDRFLVRIQAAPRRWDVIAYQFPERPEQLYLHRLVGLPGESIHIQGGAIWIDGERLLPPAELATMQWASDSEFTRPEWACDRPYQLASDEYFVLGDNTHTSYDSRFWGPVPANNLRGVVAVIYWPPSRTRILPCH